MVTFKEERDAGENRNVSMGKNEMINDDFEETAIPEYEELEKELNGMADMFRKIFLGGKVFSAVRVINRKNRLLKA